MDSWEKGTAEAVESYQTSGFTELDSEGNKKVFDGFSIGDFFKFSGEYSVVRANEIFSKIDVEGQVLSIPNHKLQEVT
ncbi:hypothetical protein ACYSNR_00150 [Enterococcus sp. LJL128]